MSKPVQAEIRAEPVEIPSPIVAPPVDDPVVAPVMDEPAAEPFVVPALEVGDWLRLGREAREAGQNAEARAVLEEAAEQFPDAAAVRQDLARLAEADKDWAAAERWWREFAALTPTAAWVVPHVAHFIRLQGRLADAEAWVGAGIDRFPNEAAVHVDHARIAEMRRDWPAAEARWADVVARFPDRSEGPVGQARVMKEQGEREAARALLEQTAERFPSAAGPREELARLAEAARDWPAAERWWREAIALNPAPWWFQFGLVTALREQGRIEDAEAAVTQQIERSPNEAWPLVEYARIAERSGDWTKALERWELVISQFRDRWDGHGGRIRALREQGGLAPAREALTEAAARFPAMSSPAHDLAWLAETQRDWPEAERWWRRFIALEPGHWRGYTGLAMALREQGNLPDADAVLAEQTDRLGHEPVIHVEYSRLAEAARDWPEAYRRWSAMAARFPATIEAAMGQARALREQRDFAGAERVLAEAVEAHPANPAPLTERARMAAAAGDWALAYQVWTEACERFPEQPGTREAMAFAALGAKDYEVAERLSAEFRDAAPSQSAGWFIAVSSMRARGASAEADALLAEAPDVIVRHHDVMAIWVTLPRASDDWAEQLVRAQAMFEAHPDSAKSHMHMIYSHAFIGNLEEAEQHAAIARSRWPDDLGLMQAEADVAIRKRDWDRALSLLEILRKLAPDDDHFRRTYDSVREQAAA